MSAEYTPYVEQPILLISYDVSQNKFSLNTQAIKYIQSISDAIAVVSMIGKKSIGKSFLLNKFLLTSTSGFPIHQNDQPSYNAYIWGKPLKGKTNTGNDISVLIIDFDGFTNNDPINLKLLIIAILISSQLLYNTNTGGIYNDNTIESFANIIELPKNIQIDNKGDRNIQCEDYSIYFPSLLWISRDDDSMILKTQGEEEQEEQEENIQKNTMINLKEFMNKMLKIEDLQDSHDNINNIDQRINQIKYHVMNLFKEKDLLTFVKPIQNNALLSNLPNCELTEIRPEFLESIMDLRKNVLSNAKPKIINDIILNGDMLSNLIKSYIENINENILPNIETTWKFVCVHANQKIFEEAIKIYESSLNGDISGKLPMIESNLESIHKSLKKKCLDLFAKHAIATSDDSYKFELRKKLKSLYKQLYSRNQEIGQKMCTGFLEREYSTIDKKIKNKEYERFEEFEADINLFYEYCMVKIPNIPNKQLAILNHLMNAIKLNAKCFIKSLEKKLDQERTIFSDIKSRLEENINQVKNSSLQAKYDLQSKLSELEFNKAELEAKERTLTENLERLKIEKNTVEANLSENFEKERAEQRKTIQGLNSIIVNNEQTIKSLQEKYSMVKGEYDRNKVLLEQKVEYYEKSFKEAIQRENETNQAMINLKTEMTTQLKETTAKFEKNIKDLQIKVENQQEKIQLYEENIESKDEQINNLMKKTSQTILEKEDRIEDLKTKLKNYEKLIQDLKEDRKYELQNAKLHYESRIEEITKKSEDVMQNIKQKEETLKGVKSRLEKENALLYQKIHFMESEINDLKNHLKESKKNHESIMKSFQMISNQASQRCDPRQVNELKESHTKEIRELSDKYEAIKNKLQTTIDELSSKNNELELLIKIKDSDHNNKELKLKEELDKTENLRQKFQEQNKLLELQKGKIFKECEERYAYKIKALEIRLEEKDQINERNLKEMNEASEEYINQLKSVFESEKQRLEKKIQEEKQKFEKQMSQQLEELEEKLKDEQAYYEEEIENLTTELKEKEIQYQIEIQNYQKEISLRQQSIETLEQYLKEAKETVNALQQKYATGMEQNMESFSQERKNFTAKIESLTLDVAKFEKENFSIKQRIEQLEMTITKKEEAHEVLINEFTEEKASLIAKNEEMKQKLQKLTDEYMGKKMEFGRELALNIQQIDFLKKKIDQLKKQNDELIAEYEEKIKIQKDEHIQNFAEFKEKIQGDQQTLEEKYMNKKKILKELQAKYNKDISNIEKEKASLLEKIYALEAKNSEKYDEDNNQIQMLNAQITKLKEASKSDKKLHAQEIDKLKKIIQNLQHENLEVSSNYERDKALWDGKFHFLEQQRDQTKSDLLDLQKKFELTVQSIQKIRNLEKDDIENSQSVLIGAIESKYKKKIEDINEEHQNAINELLDKKQKLEKDLKALNDKIMMDNYDKIGNQNMIEKRVNELMDSEKQLLTEIEELKKEREAKMIEFQNRLDGETGILRNKIKELDMKYKESENKRNTLMFEYEKDRAKWNMEKDYYVSQRNELQETINKIEKKREALLRENEKLKSESKNNRKNNNNNNSNNSALTNISLNTYHKSSASNSSRTVSPMQKNKPVYGYEKENQIYGSFLSNPKSTESYRSSFDIYKNVTLSSNLSGGMAPDQDTEDTTIF